LPPILDLALGHRLGEFTLDVELKADISPVVIIGPSGAGKTLILRAIAGILRPARGRIVVKETILFDGCDGVDVPVQDRRVGYVPQDYALFPHLSVDGNIGFGLRGASSRRRARVAEMVDLVGLEGQRGQLPRSLSGGQRQRVALARALAVRPELLLLDEPFSALDVPTRESLLDDVRRLIAATGTPTIFVTHDRNEALQLADTVGVLLEGRVRQTGTPAEVFGSPADEEVANFVGVETIAEGRVRAVEDGVATVEVGTHVIEGGTGVTAGEEVLVCLRPEDIVLSAHSSKTAPTSARNHLIARVTRISPFGPYLRVELDAEFNLVSLVTRHAVTELGLAPGSKVEATFKASAVHLIRKGMTPGARFAS
jgi:molybdenum ABC transporter ATP-binding protein